MQCAAKLCKSNNDTTRGTEKLRFFEFPSDEKIAEQWEKICKISSLRNDKITKVLCELHFELNCFDSKNQLKPDAVPENICLKRKSDPLVTNDESTKKKSNENVTLDENNIEKQNDNCLMNKIGTKKIKPYRLTVQIDKVYLRPCPKSKKPNQVKISFGVSQDIVNNIEELMITQSSNQNSLKDFENSQPCNQCLVCKEVFTVPTDLYMHLRKHFTCNICQAEFTSKKSHSKHCKTHENTVKSFPHKCEICAVSFESQEDLTKHKHITPRYVKQELDGNHSFCKICNLTFRNDNLKKKHSLIHDGKKMNPVVRMTSLPLEAESSNEFSCKICKSKLSNLADVDSHLKSHDVEKSTVLKNS